MRAAPAVHTASTDGLTISVTRLCRTMERPQPVLIRGCILETDMTCFGRVPLPCRVSRSRLLCNETRECIAEGKRSGCGRGLKVQGMTVRSGCCLASAATLRCEGDGKRRLASATRRTANPAGVANEYASTTQARRSRELPVGVPGPIAGQILHSNQYSRPRESDICL